MHSGCTRSVIDVDRGRTCEILQRDVRNAGILCWAPDGSELAFCEAGKIQTVSFPEPQMRLVWRCS